ncbi:hypothetical protein H4582DRAFT_2072159 [Lactarius indigo]|nr:hypothetical protein H4582DRAFT_2085990 [Lactarius indigo]KAI9443071.1 hypothetical protein H4582DRAFT_2072159 [Lactarius indigo]
MYAISTATFVSLLALVSSLAVVVQATGPRPQCVETYTLQQAEPCDTLATALGLSKAEILSINSEISCDGTLPAGKVLCIKQSTPTCKQQDPATATTCDGLLSKWGLSRDQFVEYNDDVNDDCSNLVPGQSVRVFPL